MIAFSAVAVSIDVIAVVVIVLVADVGSAFRQYDLTDRASLETIGSFGDGGRYPGRFYGVGSVAVDSKGNVYTGETYDGKRVQKFVKK